jgi:hypothetical protein
MHSIREEHHLDPTFVIAGRLRRDYLLPAQGRPLLDQPGGNLLYAAAGLGIWAPSENRDYSVPSENRDYSVGLLTRAGEDYPREWLRSFEKHGWDTRGIHILADALDLRYFQATLPHVPSGSRDYLAPSGNRDYLAPSGNRDYLAPSGNRDYLAGTGTTSSRPVRDSGSYAETGTTSESQMIERSNPVAHFARLGLPFPKSLLGYQPPAVTDVDHKTSHPASPRPNDIPPDYLEAHAVHICPLDYLTVSRLSSTFRQASVTTLTLDPSAAFMTGKALEDVRILLQGLTAFLPSEEELRALFWGRTDDLWQMAEALGEFGCEFIIIKRGARGQMLYDSVSKKRWEIPAYPAHLTDATGAGDSFCGGFLAGYQKTYDPLRGVLHGCVSASLTIEGSGVFNPLEALPGLAQRRLESLTGIVRQI